MESYTTVALHIINNELPKLDPKIAAQILETAIELAVEQTGGLVNVPMLQDAAEAHGVTLTI